MLQARPHAIHFKRILDLAKDKGFNSFQQYLPGIALRNESLCSGQPRRFCDFVPFVHRRDREFAPSCDVNSDSLVAQLIALQML